MWEMSRMAVTLPCVFLLPYRVLLLFVVNFTVFFILFLLTTEKYNAIL